jgi:hypothetical protein
MEVGRAVCVVLVRSKRRTPAGVSEQHVPADHRGKRSKVLWKKREQVKDGTSPTRKFQTFTVVL